MSENTKIQWCDHTFNPWIGCTKVSPGCAHCYAETETFARVRRALGHELWGKGAKRVRTSEANWKLPLKWNRQHMIQCLGCSSRYDLPLGLEESFCKSCGHPEGVSVRPRVFCASMADWLDDEIPIEWLADLLKLIHDTPNLDWLLLTKRPQNWANRVSQAMLHVDRFWINGDSERSQLGNWIGGWLEGIAPQRGLSDIPSNIWIGTSVEDQQRANERIPELLKIPARVRFLSVEPMLGPIEFPDHLGWERCRCGARGVADCSCFPIRNLHWAIFGGESGAKARPCNIEWIRDGVRRCRAAGVAPFVKQLGADVRCDNANEFDWPDDAQLEAIGNGFASCRVRLNDRKGGDMAEWPEDLRVREFPEVVR